MINIKTKEKVTSIAYVASISVQFGSEERRWRVDQRPLGLGLSLLRNHTKTLATQAKTNKGKLQRLIARHLDYQLHR